MHIFPKGISEIMKCQQFGVGFELRSPCSFSTMVTIRSQVPLHISYVYVHTCGVIISLWLHVGIGGIYECTWMWDDHIFVCVTVLIVLHLISMWV